MDIINFTKPETGNFIVDIIIWLVQISSSIVLGIVLFTLLLKIITLPFDYFSRASMRKNSLKMEEMRPELEKLQKQYADNKDLYNQKMMALYKKNGYSMFGACLPTILTLVIFIVALNGFSAYSRWQNKQYFYDMSVAYNNVVYAGFDIDVENEYITRDSEGAIILDLDDIKEKAENGESINGKNAQGEDFEIFASITEKVTENQDEKNYTLSVSTENGYMQVNVDYTDTNGEIKWGTVYTYELIEEKIETTTLLCRENNNLKMVVDGKNYTYAEVKELEGYEELTEEEFIIDIRQYKSSETFKNENEPFLWVKNIWVSDSPTKHPVESNWKTFQDTHQYKGNDILDSGYAELIAKLDREQEKANGYFILVALTIGISLVTQIVMGKTQKAQMELQTVDGQGAQTQKMMKWMMPIMMGIFAFMYTAAFSIYIILSSVVSLGTTFLINFIVDRRYKKENVVKNDQKIRGRIYVKKEEPKQEEKKEPKKRKDDKFAHEDGKDFLSGKADKKKNRVKR